MSATRAEKQTLRFAEIGARVCAAVERVAATDPSPSDPFRGLYVSDETALDLALADDPSSGEFDARLAAASDLLGLDELDGLALALCIAPELDPRFGRLIGYLHDDLTRRCLTPRLAVRLLADNRHGRAEILGRFSRDRPLRLSGALRLVDTEHDLPLADRPVKVAERLAAEVLGAALDGGPGAHRGRHVDLPTVDPGRGGSVAELRALLANDSRLPVLVAGPDAPELLAIALGRPVLIADGAICTAAAALDDLILEAALTGARLCFELPDLPPGAERNEIVATLTRRPERILMCAASPRSLVAFHGLEAVLVEVPAPSFDERLTLWARQTASDEVREVAAKFRLSAAQIAHAVEVAELVASVAGRPRPAASDLHYGARQASSRRLDGLATRVELSSGWADLVLPRRQMESLRSVSAHLRHRDLVLSAWGYERTVGQGQGLKILFFGDSGTGKTMAGRVLARELGLDLYRIDLAAVVSKYIGETEKNLDVIFEAATGSNAILFFDEADALFGRRSDVGDAHDRYANIEVAYLLQRMETYAGAVILATNFRSNIDDAFLRRLDFAVEFPFPEPEYRGAIWRAVLPAAAPVAPDIDVAALARRYKLSGGSIRNSSLAAAFLAADDGGRIEMRHLLLGVAAEYVKLGRLTVATDFEPARPEPDGRGEP